MKTKLIITIVVVAAAVGLYVYWRQRGGFNVSTLSDKQLQALNAPAQSGGFNLPAVKWLPNGQADVRGPIEYKVSWGSASGPAISKIVFAPYDVKPGDMQDIYAVAGDKDGVKSLAASIKTDVGVENIALKLVQGDAKNGVWQASWKVHDTHVGYYTATFAVASLSGAMRSTSVVFMDDILSSIFGETALAANGAEQCNIPTTGAYTIAAGNTCTIAAGSSDSVVNGTTTIGTTGAAATLSLAANATFGFTNGYSVILGSGGSISIGSGAKLIKLGVGSPTYNDYVEDRDGDHWWDAQTVATSNPYGGLNSGLRSSSYSGGGDCYDVQGGAGATSTYPGQTAFFTTANGAGSFDYNCDGVQTQEYTTTGGQCETCTWVNPSCNNNYVGATGWATSTVPNCGSSSAYVSDPGSTFCSGEPQIKCTGINTLCSSGNLTQACN